MPIDPAAAAESVLFDVLGAVAIAALTLLAAWIAGPLRWPFQNHALKKLLHGRRFVFVFNPAVDKKKIVTFSDDGTIGAGRNDNEHTWRITRGMLEIIHQDGTPYSRFKRDRESGQLRHTNEPTLPSIHGQYFQPEYFPKREGELVTPEPAVKWVDTRYPQDSGLQARFEAAGYTLAWTTEAKLQRRIELEGAQIAVDLADPNTPLMFKVKDTGRNLVLIARKRQGP